MKLNLSGLSAVAGAIPGVVNEFLDITIGGFAHRLEIERERGQARALGMTDDEFDEVLDLCRQFDDARAWSRETFIFNLHTRMMIRGGAHMWQPCFWYVPYLSSLELLDPDHQEGETS